MYLNIYLFICTICYKYNILLFEYNIIMFLFSEKYRDLIDAADTIGTMAMIVSDIANVTEEILKTNQINQEATLDR